MLEFAVTANIEKAPLFSESMTAVNSVTKGNEDITSTVVKSDSDATEYKSQLPSKPVVKPISDTRSEIERSSADLSVVVKTNVEATVQSRLTKWTSTLELEVFEAVASTFEVALQAIYSNSINSFKFAMFSFDEHALDEVVQSSLAPRVSEAKYAHRCTNKICSVHDHLFSTFQHRIQRSARRDR